MSAPAQLFGWQPIDTLPCEIVGTFDVWQRWHNPHNGAVMGHRLTHCWTDHGKVYRGESSAAGYPISNVTHWLQVPAPPGVDEVTV